MSRTRLPAYKPSVLVYHHISAGKEGKGGPAKDSVHIRDFERQMRLLVERGFHALSLGGCVAAIEKGAALPSGTVVITFDDGYRSTYTRALPVLLEYGLAACVFVVTDAIADGPRRRGGPAGFHWLPPNDDEDAGPMSWAEAEAAVAKGMEIGSHTATHPFLPAMAGDWIESELVRSREKIEARVGRAPFAAALPFSFPLHHRRWPSFETDLMAGLRRASYSCCCTLQRGGVTGGDGVIFLPRVAVTGSDGLRSFHAKALGLYRYTGLPQRVYQGFFKKYA